MQNDMDFDVEIPDHNPKCDGCLKRALMTAKMAGALTSLADESKKQTQLLEDIKASTQKIERDIYGADGESGIKAKVQRLHTIYTMVMGNKWLVTTFGGTALALVWFTVKHLIEEGIFSK